MNFNLPVLLVAAIVPLIIGFIWYNPKVFGTAWMKACAFNAEDMKKPNPLIFLWCYLLSVLIAVILTPVVIHQFGFFSALMNEPGLNDSSSEIYSYASDFMGRYGQNFRTFKQGAFHGITTAVLLILHIMGTNAMFEKRSFKYVMVNAGY